MGLDDNKPQALTARAREKGWFVDHEISGKYLECEWFISIVSFA